MKIIPYNKDFKKRFKKEKERIAKIVKDRRIYHVGSTAVPGLGGKGIIDIMIVIDSWKDIDEIIKKLRKLGFKHVHPKEKGRIFLSKNTSLSLNNVHIHIVKVGSREYKELLYFRDYLKKNKKEAENYNNLKIRWLKDAKSNREKYGKLKSKYINNILSRKV